VYEEQDRATRTRTAWERSDQQKLTELEEISTQLPLKKWPLCEQRPSSYL
jgi:hypothetical protein